MVWCFVDNQFIKLLRYDHMDISQGFHPMMSIMTETKKYKRKSITRYADFVMLVLC